MILEKYKYVLKNISFRHARCLRNKFQDAFYLSKVKNLQYAMLLNHRQISLNKELTFFKI